MKYLKSFKIFDSYNSYENSLTGKGDDNQRGHSDITKWLADLNYFKKSPLLPEPETNIYKIRRLYFVSKNITELPESISELRNLEYLDLSGNKLTKLPESISELRNLKYLNLSGNQIGRAHV